MNKTTSQKRPWTKGEKFLLGAILMTVALAAFGYFSRGHASETPSVAIPTPTMPTQNAFDSYNAAVAQEQDKNKVEWAYVPWAERKHDGPYTDRNDRYYSPAGQAALVQENGVALQTFRQGLARPYLQPPVRSDKRIFIKSLFNHLSIAHLMALDSRVKAERGDWDGATQSGLDVVQMGEQVPHGGPLSGMVVGRRCQSIGRHCLWDYVGHLNAAQAAAAARRLEALRGSHVSLANVMQEEEWTGEATLLNWFKDDSGWRCYSKGLLPVRDLVTNSNGMGWNRQQQMEMLLITKKTEMRHYQNYMDQAVRNARQPYAANVPASATHLDPLTQWMTEDDGRTAQYRDAETEAQNALLMVTFALRAYRLEHQAYPATLNALVPTYLSCVPDDPFALSGPLHYKRQGNKYLLYSIGPDGKDDGGKPIFDNSKPPLASFAHGSRYDVEQNSTGDIVAGVNQQ